MAEIRALLPDGTAPSTLLEQIRTEAVIAGQDAAANVPTPDASRIPVTVSTEDGPVESTVGQAIQAFQTVAGVAASADQKAVQAQTAADAVASRVDAVEASLSSESIRIFPTQEEAAAWEAEVPGRIGLWVDQEDEPVEPEPTDPIEVTAPTPTFDDAADTYTIPVKTGVRYLVGGVVRTGTVTVGDVDTTVTITAQAETGYTLTGTSSWTGTYKKKAAASADSTAAAGTILASDDFTGDGPLLGRTAVASLGGTARTWRDGTGGNATTTGGVVAPGSNSGYTILPADRRDVEASFLLTSLPTAGASISIRDSGASHRLNLNFTGSGGVRVQRFGPAGGTVIAGMSASIGTASVGKRMSLRAVGSDISLTLTGNTGSEVTLTGTDSGWLEAGVGVGVAAGAGFGIDDLVVTAR